MRFRRKRREVHPSTHDIFKFMPHNPPEKGDVVLVDGERCRVVKAKIDWDERVWTLKRLWVSRLSDGEK